jgi:hypothetical protein
MSYYYNKSIEVYTGVFGSLFSNYQIRSNNKLVKIPIEFEAKNKSVVRSDVDLDETKIKRTLPRMSFNLLNWEKDNLRKTNAKLKNIDRNYSNGQSVASQYNRVPYNFTYELRIKTKNISEMCQIVEQILAQYDEPIKIVIKDNDDLNTETDVFIKLVASDNETQAVGSFDDYRSVETTMQFILEGYIYKETSSNKTIQSIVIDMGVFEPELYLDSVVIE